jgi:hypothetical protein
MQIPSAPAELLLPVLFRGQPRKPATSTPAPGLTLAQQLQPILATPTPAMRPDYAALDRGLTPSPEDYFRGLGQSIDVDAVAEKLEEQYKEKKKKKKIPWTPDPSWQAVDWTPTPIASSTHSNPYERVSSVLSQDTGRHYLARTRRRTKAKRVRKRK